MCGKAEMTSSARSASAGVDAPKLVPLRGRVRGFDHRGGGVAENERPPGADVVDVFVAVGVPEMGALAAHHERRIAAHRAEGAHGEFTPPGIIFSARFCSLRDCSNLRAMRPPYDRQESLTIAAAGTMGAGRSQAIVTH